MTPMILLAMDNTYELWQHVSKKVFMVSLNEFTECTAGQPPKRFIPVCDLVLDHVIN
jgi:hypothetical protein